MARGSEEGRIGEAHDPAVQRLATKPYSFEPRPRPAETHQPQRRIRPSKHLSSRSKDGATDIPAALWPKPTLEGLLLTSSYLSPGNE